MNQYHGGGGEDDLIVRHGRYSRFGNKQCNLVDKTKLESVNFLPKFFKFSWPSLSYNPKNTQWDQFPSSGSSDAVLKSVFSTTAYNS